MTCLLLLYKKSVVAQQKLRKGSCACHIDYSQQEQNTESEKILFTPHFSSHNLPNEGMSTIAKLCFGSSCRPRIMKFRNPNIIVGTTGPVCCYHDRFTIFPN
jgi:hypothetical protein